MKNPDEKGTDRRGFLKTGFAAGAAGVAGFSLINSLTGQASEDGEKIKLLSPEGELIEVDKSLIHPAVSDLKVDVRKGIPGKKFIMVIDLGKCRNARKCITACQKMHHLPEDKEWLQVYAKKDGEDGAPYWFPKTCFHCDNPPCVKVCPVGATFKRDDNLVLIDNDRCIGCKFCMAACPYSTRVFNWNEPEPIEEGSCGHSSHENGGCCSTTETSVPQQMGTVSKCDFCPDMARKGKLPDCVTACPNGVFYFGDKNEDVVTNGSETVKFSQLIKDKAGYRYAEDLGTEPNVYYLPPANRQFPFERGLDDMTVEDKMRYKDVIDIKDLLKDQ